MQHLDTQMVQNSQMAQYSVQHLDKQMVQHLDTQMGLEKQMVQQMGLDLHLACSLKRSQ